MSAFPLARRQVHLDFHTSSLIPDIAREFNPELFAQQIKQSAITSITCFGRCHHGMLYYPSRIHADAVHPELACEDLLGEQIKACHNQGIKAPVYLTVQWDQRLSESKPEWCMQNREGGQIVAEWSEAGFYKDGFYTFLCVNSPYRQFIQEEINELQNRYAIDGFFFDILYPRDCHCQHCRQLMLDQGIDHEDAQATLAFSAQTMAKFKLEISELVRSNNASASVYYNTSHVHPGYHAFLPALSHIEVESLPSGSWGYDHFPVIGRYARTLGKPVMGMTGKSHTSWGDFHSLKTPEALEYECFLMNALNASCSIGDQMHPDGKLSEASYQLIGNVYQQLEQLEPYSQQATPVIEMAILNPEEGKLDANLHISQSLIGACRLLQEAGFQFDVIDSSADLSDYKLLVMPDDYFLTETIAKKLQHYLAKGGKVLAAGESPFDQSLNITLLPEFKVNPKGSIPYSPDFIVPRSELSHLVASQAIPAEETVMYHGSVAVEALPDVTIKADIVAPYFNRHGRHFCSHQHSPSSRDVIHPGLVATANTAYFSNPVFRIYGEKAPSAVRALVADQCRELLKKPLVTHNGPSSLLVTLNHQPEQKRYIVHLLHYVPEAKCSDLLIVDSKLPLVDLELTVSLDRIRRVNGIGQKSEISEVHIDADAVSFTVDRMNGYQLISLEY